MSKDWSKEEIDYLREHYSRNTVNDVAKHLGRSSNAVRIKAQRMEILTDRYLSAEEEKYILDNINKITYREIANNLGRCVTTIKRYCIKNGLRSERYWTEDEDKYLEERIPYNNYSSIAKKLGRSVVSVKCRASQKGIAYYMNKDTYNLAEIAEILGKSKKAIHNLVKSKKLKSRMINNHRAISEESLVEFMLENPKRWDATKVDRYFFMKYDWFEEKRKADFDKMVGKKWGDVV